jgi:ABC-type uncharacterized transport system substrate-binding protein
MINIGFLVSATKTNWRKYIKAFETGLTTYGWVDGTYNIDYGPATVAGVVGAAENSTLIQQCAQAFATATSPSYDVIVTAGYEAALACQTETSKVGSKPPVVYAAVGNPTALTGTNLTGCSNMQLDPTLLQLRINTMQGNLKSKVVGVIGNPAAVNTAMKLVWDKLNATAGITVASPTCDGRQHRNKDRHTNSYL